MEAKHTPGPWSITTCADYWIKHAQPITEADDDFRGVAHVGDIGWPNSGVRQQEWEANARLIAAAPDMATDGAFLLARLDEFERSLTEDDASREFHGHVAPAIARFRAAIAKATGQ